MGHALDWLRVQVYCDNTAVVTVINSGKTSDPLMGKILHNAWLQVSSQEFEIRAVHLPGVTNRLADYLSGWHLDVAKYSGLFAAECGDAGSISEETVTDELFALNSDLLPLFFYRCRTTCAGGRL